MTWSVWGERAFNTDISADADQFVGFDNIVAKALSVIMSIGNKLHKGSLIKLIESNDWLKIAYKF